MRGWCGWWSRLCGDGLRRRGRRRRDVAVGSIGLGYRRRWRRSLSSLGLIWAFFLLEPRGREPDRDRRSLTELALHQEGPTADRSPLAHHRHAVVTLGLGCLDIEPDAVVPQHHLDLVVPLLLHADPDVRRLGV